MEEGVEEGEEVMFALWAVRATRRASPFLQEDRDPVPSTSAKFSFFPRSE